MVIPLWQELHLALKMANMRMFLALMKEKLLMVLQNISSFAEKMVLVIMNSCIIYHILHNLLIQLLNLWSVLLADKGLKSQYLKTS